MIRALATTVLACLLGAAVLAASSGVHAGLLTLWLLLAVSAGALAAAFAVRRARRRIGSIARQLALAAGVAVGAILAAVWVAASVMFISSDDALTVSVMATVVAAVSLSSANLLTRDMVQDIQRLRRRLRGVGEGDRSADLRTGGEDELADLAAAANAMIERLSREEAARAGAEQARRRLIVSISHDLRTPLTALRVLTEAVEDRIVTGATRARYLREMQTHMSVLSTLIDDLFELSRAEAGELALASRPVPIGEVVSETVAAMRAAGEARGVTLAVEPPAGRASGPALAAHADPEQIRRVLLNLLDNAIRHSPPGGNVVARVSGLDATVEVEVADEGGGIAPDERERVFEAFYRGGENPARAGDGAGLGLAIAHAIVKAHSGEIWLAPARRGTRIRFSLPASGRPARQPAERPVTPASSA